MKQFEKQGIEMEEQRKQILKELEQKYRNSTQLAEEYEEKIKANKKILDQSRIGIQSLFTKINCDRSQIDILLLSKEGVTETNMSQYLGIVDSRTDELLKWQSILSSKKENVPFKDRAPNYIGEGAQSKQFKPIVTIPSTGLAFYFLFIFILFYKKLKKQRQNELCVNTYPFIYKINNSNSNIFIIAPAPTATARVIISGRERINRNDLTSGHEVAFVIF